MFHFLLAFVFATVTVYDSRPSPVVGVGKNPQEAQLHIDTLKLRQGHNFNWINANGIVYSTDLRNYTFCKSTTPDGRSWFTALYGELTDVVAIKAGVDALIAEHQKVFNQHGQLLAYAASCKPYTQQPEATALSLPGQQFAAASAAGHVQSTQPAYTHVISFGPGGNPNNALSNYWQKDVEVEGTTYKSGEHAYQAFKFIPHSAGWNKVMQAATPDDARTAGQATQDIKPEALDQRNKPTWYRTIKDWMNKIVRAKYAKYLEVQDVINQNPAAYFVEDTGDRQLVSQDRTWGIGYDNEGRNQLGLLWTLIARGLPYSGQLLETVRLTRTVSRPGDLGTLSFTPLSVPLSGYPQSTMTAAAYAPSTAQQGQQLFFSQQQQSALFWPQPVYDQRGFNSLATLNLFPMINGQVNCVGFWGRTKDLWIVMNSVASATNLQTQLGFGAFTHKIHNNCVIIPAVQADRLMNQLSGTPVNQENPTLKWLREDPANKRVLGSSDCRPK